MRLGLSMEALVTLDQEAAAHLRAPSGSELAVIEAGSRRLRVALEGAHGVDLAARRIHLPDDAAADAWEQALTRQDRALERAGISVLPAGTQRVAPVGPARILWVVRPRVPDADLVVSVLRAASPDTARRVGETLLTAAEAVARTPGAAAPAEPSAWAWLDGELVLVHNDTPAELPAAVRHGPWRWWAALVRGAWLEADAPLSSDAERIVAGTLAPLAHHASLEGVVPTLRALLGPDPRERLARAEQSHRRWARRVQALRRPR